MERALVTGGSSGIGLALTKKLTSRKGNEQMEVHSFDVQKPRQRVRGLIAHTPVDVSKEDQVAEAMQSIQGQLHYLFVNAGILSRKGLFEIPPEEFQRMINVNFFGSWLTLKTALDQNMLAPDAKVVQTCSIVGIEDDLGMALAPYKLSKQGVHAYGKAVHAVLPDVDFKVIYPGSVDTPMVNEGFASRRQWLKQAKEKWGYVSSPEEVADAMLNLAESDARRAIWNSMTEEFDFD
ncbi:MAG: SDR family oxidoreductase [Candidatus Peregrinibacteria bacterium]|nr:SDR family oxidoreductase [Candidatus Peregrinibacteria bacterium]